jgi:hypothetical protein
MLSYLILTYLILSYLVLSYPSDVGQYVYYSISFNFNLIPSSLCRIAISQPSIHTPLWRVGVGVRVRVWVGVGGPIRPVGPYAHRRALSRSGPIRPAR